MFVMNTGAASYHMVVQLNLMFVAHCCKKCISIERSATHVWMYRLHVILGWTTGEEDVGSDEPALFLQCSLQESTSRHCSLECVVYL